MFGRRRGAIVGTEIEQKFEVPVGSISVITESLRNDASLGNFTVSYLRKVSNLDTYFDVNGEINSRNWSLRVREKNAGISVTLKRPQPASGGSSATHREELENPQDGTLVEVLDRIVAILCGEGIIPVPPCTVESLVHRHGAIAALRRLDLVNTYPVRTSRDVWKVVDASGDVAELAIDETEYLDAVQGSVREGRIEVEIYDPAQAAKLAEIRRHIKERFNARDVRNSKFQQALIHHASQHLRDKLEAKVTLQDIASYDNVAAQIDGSGEFVRGYRFHRLADRRIADVYFDTKKYELFKLGWYLRLRREQDTEEYTFRRLKERGEQRYGTAMQQEIVVRSSSDLEEAWSAIRGWLSGIRGLSRVEAPADFGHLRESLVESGLQESLEVDVSRSSWIVDRASGIDVFSVPDFRNRIAKVKYDRVTYRHPGTSNPLSHFEFEVTGVEDEDAAPNSLRRDSFQAFLGDFVEVCADRTNGGLVDRRTSAKYFYGLTELGIVDKPEWLADGRLSVQLLAREIAPKETLTRNTGLMRFWSALATLIAGLFALSVGEGDGFWRRVHRVLSR